jgi:DNA-binding GntR family transcriptional regulator
MEHLKRRLHQDPVFTSLRRAIVRGQLPAGSRIIERDVAADLGISRTPVREAFARLQRDGLISAVPGRQRNLLEVAPLTVRELRQMSAATAALEGIGASEATSQPTAARRSLASQLDALLDSAVKELSSPEGSFARALDLDERFHRLLADDFLEPSTSRCLESARTHVYRYIWMFSRKTGVSAADFKAEHAPMVAALRKGDVAAVCAALQANWSRSATRITEFLEDV